MQAAPIPPERLVARLAGAAGDLADTLGHPARVAVDGAPATDPGGLADAVAEMLRAAGRTVARVSATGFARPASVRLELGREDPDNLYENGLDLVGLRREVLQPLGPGGSGTYLPVLWDVERDRSPRAGRVALPAAGILLLDGSFLLGAGLPLDLAVHLGAGPAALRRRTPAADRWTLAAHARYAEEVDPAGSADVVVRVDDPLRPALVAPSAAGRGT